LDESAEQFLLSIYFFQESGQQQTILTAVCIPSQELVKLL
jgi:hypothetical protein